MTPAACGELTEWQLRQLAWRVDDLNEQAKRNRETGQANGR